MQWCRHAFQELSEGPRSPSDADYLMACKTPFLSIQSKLENGEYGNIAEFRVDVSSLYTSSGTKLSKEQCEALGNRFRGLVGDRGEWEETQGEA